MSKCLSVKYLLISQKKTGSLAQAVEKLDFLGPYFRGGPERVAPKNLGRQNCVCSSTTLHKSLILIFCGLGEEHTRFKKK